MCNSSGLRATTMYGPNGHLDVSPPTKEELAPGWVTETQLGQGKLNNGDTLEVEIKWSKLNDKEEVSLSTRILPAVGFSFGKRPFSAPEMFVNASDLYSYIEEDVLG